MTATETRMRLGWIQLYEEMKDAGYVCRQCGISRPTLRMWLRRYKEAGLNGRRGKSKKPGHSPNRKIFEKQEEWILKLRDEMNIGGHRIQNELVRQYDCHLSLASIQKGLQRSQVKPIQKPHRRKKLKRDQKAIPGEPVQLDTCKIRPGMDQFTAKVQERLVEWHIKFRPSRPGAPHLNGKVERAQKTVLDEFYALDDLNDPELSLKLSEWQHFITGFGNTAQLEQPQRKNVAISIQRHLIGKMLKGSSIQIRNTCEPSRIWTILTFKN